MEAIKMEELEEEVTSKEESDLTGYESTITIKEPPKKSKKGWTIAGIFLGIATIFVGGALVIGNKKSKTDYGGSYSDDEFDSEDDYSGDDSTSEDSEATEESNEN